MMRLRRYAYSTGQGMVEYALLLMFVALAAVALLRAVGGSVVTSLSNVPWPW